MIICMQKAKQAPWYQQRRMKDHYDTINKRCITKKYHRISENGLKIAACNLFGAMSDLQLIGWKEREADEW